MKIEGVPEGWELVRIGRPDVGEWNVGHDGEPWFNSEKPIDGVHEYWAIIRKVEPACSWPLGVFADGWIAEDIDEEGYHYMWWHSHKPEVNKSLYSWEPTERSHECFSIDGGFLLAIVKFRADLPWTERIQQVGPTFEAGLKGEV